MTLLRLLQNRAGASAAEFAMVLPLLLILLLGIIDGGRFMWEYNRAEKATQNAVRYAVVTAPVAGGVASADLVGVSQLKAGDPIPASLVPDITCNNSSCSCSGCPGELPGTYDGTAFNNIVAQVQRFEPTATAANVEVIYRGSGLGYAGDPTGPDLSPLVTIKVSGLQFTPITSLLFATFTKPDFSSTLTAEDLAGSVSS